LVTANQNETATAGSFANKRWLDPVRPRPCGLVSTDVDYSGLFAHAECKNLGGVIAKAETLRRIVTLLLAPVSAANVAVAQSRRPRELDPLWQVGHAAFDACRALVAPFDPKDELIARFDDHFHGRRNRDPWDTQRPEPDAVLAWWDDILAGATATLASRALSNSLPEPVRFTAYTVHSLNEAYDYTIYHTSFHLGLAQGLLGGAHA